jgi:hypothetical protein
VRKIILLSILALAGCARPESHECDYAPDRSDCLWQRVETSMSVAAIANGRPDQLESIHRYVQNQRMRSKCQRFMNFEDEQNGAFDRCAAAYRY